MFDCVQEYVRQVLLEKIIRESEQAALREQAASLLAASQPVAARGGQSGFLGGGRYGAPAQQPASGMKAFHQQHLQNQMLQVHPLCTRCPLKAVQRHADQAQNVCHLHGAIFNAIQEVSLLAGCCWI